MDNEHNLSASWEDQILDEFMSILHFVFNMKISERVNAHADTFPPKIHGLRVQPRTDDLVVMTSSGSRLLTPAQANLATSPTPLAPATSSASTSRTPKPPPPIPRPLPKGPPPPPGAPPRASSGSHQAATAKAANALDQLIAMGIPVDLDPETEEEVRCMELAQQEPPIIMQLLGAQRKLEGSGESVKLFEYMMILFLA